MRFITLTLPSQSMGRPDETRAWHVNVDQISSFGTSDRSTNGNTVVGLTSGFGTTVLETVEQVLELINGTDAANTHATPVRGLTELHLDDLAAHVRVEIAWIESQGLVGTDPRGGWHKCHRSLVSVERELRGEA